MARGSRIAVVALLAAATVTALAGPAAARGRESVTASISLHGTRGYSIQIKAEPGRVELSASKGAGGKGRNGFGATLYTVPGRFDGERMRARFGQFGLVDLVFHPTGRPVGIPEFPGCHGAESAVKGRFVGTIRFRGDGGYTRVASHGAPGEVTRERHRNCGGGDRRGGRGRSEEHPETLLEARRGQVKLLALGDRPSDLGPPIFPDERGTSLVGVSAVERRGRLSIERLAAVFADQSAFRFDTALTTATVRPPPPFRGRAEFRRGPGGAGSWSGSLSVSVPGREIRLTGAGFRVHLTGQSADRRG